MKALIEIDFTYKTSAKGYSPTTVVGRIKQYINKHLQEFATEKVVETIRIRKVKVLQLKEKDEMIFINGMTLSGFPVEKSIETSWLDTNLSNEELDEIFYGKRAHDKYPVYKFLEKIEGNRNANK